MSDDGTVILCMLVTGGAASLAQLGAGHLPPVRIGVGVMAGTLMLLVLGHWAPQLASGLAITAMLTSLFVAGEPLWAGIAKGVSR